MGMLKKNGRKISLYGAEITMSLEFDEIVIIF